MVKTRKNKNKNRKKVKVGGTSLALPQTTRLIYTEPVILQRTKRNNELSNMYTKYGINKYTNKISIDINRIVKNIENNYLNTPISSYKETKDYKKYGLIPGQQIAYGGGFGISILKHYGIYLGNGEIYELAPQSENVNSRYGPEISIGLSTVRDFVRKGENKPSPIYVFDSKEIPNDNKDIIRQRLQRIKEINLQTRSRNKQLIIYGNCEHVANKIAFDKFVSVQADIFSGTITIGILLYKGRNFITKIINDDLELISCQDVFTTKEGCVCDSQPEHSSIYGSTCSIDPKVSCNLGNFKLGHIKSLVEKHRSRYTNLYWGRLGKKSQLKLRVTKKKIKHSNKYKYVYKWQKCN